MNFPIDTPLWFEKAMRRIEDDMKEDLAKARSSDESLRSTGAFWLWRRIEEEVNFEADKQAKELARQNALLNARRDDTGSDA